MVVLVPPSASAVSTGPGSAALRLERWLAPGYDVALYIRHESYYVAAPMVRAPAVVDIDDVPQVVTQRRHSARLAIPPAIREGMRSWFDRVDTSRWNRMDRMIRDDSAVFLVCSEHDRRLYPEGLTLVVPNGFDIPDSYASVEKGAPLNLLFQGEMIYPPNADAAEVLIGGVFPLVRAHFSDAKCTIAGPVRDADACPLGRASPARLSRARSQAWRPFSLLPTWWWSRCASEEVRA